MLHKAAGYHHIAHIHTRPDATRNPGENNARDAEMLKQGGGRGGRRHLADSGQGQHHRLPMKLATPKITARTGDTPGVLQQLKQALLFLRQGA